MGDNEDLEKIDEMIKEEEKKKPCEKMSLYVLYAIQPMLCTISGENLATSTGARTADTQARSFLKNKSSKCYTCRSPSFASWKFFIPYRLCRASLK